MLRPLKTVDYEYVRTGIEDLDNFFANKGYPRGNTILDLYKIFPLTLKKVKIKNLMPR
jgi:hypothetical protein